MSWRIKSLIVVAGGFILSSMSFADEPFITSKEQFNERMNEGKVKLRKEIFALNKKVLELQDTVKKREDDIRHLVKEQNTPKVSAKADMTQLQLTLDSAERDIEQKASTIRWLDDSNQILKLQVEKKDQELKELKQELNIAHNDLKQAADAKPHYVKEATTPLSENIKLLESKLTRQEIESKTQFEEWNTHYNQLKIERDALANELAVVRDLKNNLSSKVEELSTKIVDHEKSLPTHIEDAKIAYVEQLATLAQQLQDAKQEIKALRASVATADKNVLKSVSNATEPLEASIQFLQKKLLAVENSIRTNEETIAQLTQINKLKQDELNRLGRALDEKEAAFLEISAERDKLRKNIDQLTEQIDELRSKIFAKSSADFEQSELRQEK